MNCVALATWNLCSPIELAMLIGAGATIPQRLFNRRERIAEAIRLFQTELVPKLQHYEDRKPYVKGRHAPPRPTKTRAGDVALDPARLAGRAA